MLGLEVVVLFSLAVVWMIFAAIEDIKTSEIANWLNFSLAIFAIGFRFFYSLFELDSFAFFYQGLIGLAIFFVLGNLLYYSKMFAGGDAKLMYSLGAILPISTSFLFNVKIFIIFIMLFLFVGAFYGIFVSIYYGFRNFSRLKKELKVQLRNKKRLTILLISVSLIFALLAFYQIYFLYFGIFLFILPYFYLYVKSIDEACMVKKIKTSKLTLGDWLYEDVKVGKKIVKATWDGVNEEDMKLLKKKDYVLVRYGVQFAPTFLISFVLFWVGLELGWFVSFF